MSGNLIPNRHHALMKLGRVVFPALRGSFIPLRSKYKFLLPALFLLGVKEAKEAGIKPVGKNVPDVGI